MGKQSIDNTVADLKGPPSPKLCDIYVPLEDILLPPPPPPIYFFGSSTDFYVFVWPKQQKTSVIGFSL